MKPTDILGNIKLYNADCMELLKQTPDKYYSLALVDPPYGIGMSNSNKRTKPSRPNSYTKYADFRYHEANWDNERPTAEYFEQLFRVSKEQVIFGANYFCEYLPSGKGWLFWNKLNGLDNCFSDGEFAFTSKGIQSKYFECSVFHNLRGGKDRIHPTQKPVKVLQKLIEIFTDEGDVVIDPCCGSGATLRAARELNRPSYGFEIDRVFYQRARDEMLRPSIDNDQIKLEAY